MKRVRKTADTVDERSVYVTVPVTGLTARIDALLRKAGDSLAYRAAISGRRISGLNPLREKVLIAAPLSPLPQRGELGPSVSKVVLCGLVAERIIRLQSNPG